MLLASAYRSFTQFEPKIFQTYHFLSWILSGSTCGSRIIHWLGTTNKDKKANILRTFTVAWVSIVIVQIVKYQEIIRGVVKQGGSTC